MDTLNKESPVEEGAEEASRRSAFEYWPQSDEDASTIIRSSMILSKIRIREGKGEKLT
jgi:hypothetical protein